jgi:hypothetical protein
MATTASPRDTVLGSMLIVGVMAFLSGVFLMAGVQKCLQGDRIYLVLFAEIPLFGAVIVLHVRRALNALSDRQAPPAS